MDVMEVSSENASLGNRLWNFGIALLEFKLFNYLIKLSQLHRLTRGISFWKLY